MEVLLTNRVLSLCVISWYFAFSNFRVVVFCVIASCSDSLWSLPYCFSNLSACLFCWKVLVANISLEWSREIEVGIGE